MIQESLRKILKGVELSEQEAYALADVAFDRADELIAAAKKVTEAFVPSQFDSCSIINARSGKCSENCKWCAQSAHYTTAADVYPLIDHDTCMRGAEAARKHGIRRYSLVTSGRKLSGSELDHACQYISEMKEQGGLSLCASMGLLNKEELSQLKEAGVTRYHCNLESAPSYFTELCSTHSTEDKLVTIACARELGMEICSGGIIGMGETIRQRVELALTLRKCKPMSIPINILCPIKGTPLQNAQPLSQQEILLTIALFRMIHPKVTLRFAGGRAALTPESQLEALKIGVNGAIVGDLLTTVGSTVAADKALTAEAGYEF